jgi:uncharacterized protein
MGTFLRLAIILFGIWLVVRIVKRYLAEHRHPPIPSAPQPPADMLRCDYCGTFVPRAEAIRTDDKNYCSGEHAEADRRKQ